MDSYIFCVLLLLGLTAVSGAADTEHSLLYRERPSKDAVSSNLGMYGGKGISIKKHPSVVILMYYGAFLCAGSIVDDSWVLTTADCAYGIDQNSLNITAGSQDGVSGKSYGAKQIVVHPNYGSSFLDYEYALIQIHGKFKYSSKVKKIGLPKKEAKDGAAVLITGYGEAASGADASLQQGTMKVLNQKKCATIYADYGIPFTSRIACIYNKGKTTPCTNDWADPITKGKTLNYMFVAIATSGECSKDALPALCADVKPAVSWIKKTIKGK